MGDDMLGHDDEESLLLEEELSEVEIPEQLLEEGLDDGRYAVVDDVVYEVVEDAEGNQFMKSLGQFLDEQAEEQLIAMKNITVQLFEVGKGVAKHIGAFGFDPDHYFEIQKSKFRKGLGKIGTGVRKIVTGVVQTPGNVVTDVRISARNTGRKISRSARDLGDRVREEGLPGIAAGAVKKAGEGLEGAVSTVAEGKLASSDDLYVPGFEGMLIGDYLPETLYERDAHEVSNFLVALRDDYEMFPEDLGLGIRNGQTREKILEDFLHYGTSQVRMLLMHLGLRRADFANDPDRTLTKNQVDVLKGPIGDRITEMRSTYLQGREEE